MMIDWMLTVVLLNIALELLWNQVWNIRVEKQQQYFLHEIWYCEKIGGAL